MAKSVNTKEQINHLREIRNKVSHMPTDFVSSLDNGSRVEETKTCIRNIVSVCSDDIQKEINVFMDFVLREKNPKELKNLHKQWHSAPNYIRIMVVLMISHQHQYCNLQELCFYLQQPKDDTCVQSEIQKLLRRMTWITVSKMLELYPEALSEDDISRLNNTEKLEAIFRTIAHENVSSIIKSLENIIEGFIEDAIEPELQAASMICEESPENNEEPVTKGSKEVIEIICPNVKNNSTDIIAIVEELSSRQYIINQLQFGKDADWATAECQNATGKKLFIEMKLKRGQSDDPKWLERLRSNEEGICRISKEENIEYKGSEMGCIVLKFKVNDEVAALLLEERIQTGSIRIFVKDILKECGIKVDGSESIEIDFKMIEIDPKADKNEDLPGEESFIRQNMFMLLEEFDPYTYVLEEDSMQAALKNAKKCRPFDRKYHSYLILKNVLSKMEADAAYENAFTTILKNSKQLFIIRKFNEHKEQKSADQLTDKSRKKTFFDAISGHNIPVVKDLLKKGLDVNIHNKNNHDRTALHEAISYGHSDTVNILIDAKADVNAKDKDQDTPLLIATSQGDVDIVNALLDAKADINVQNKFEETPLHKAAWSGHSDTVKVLIDAKADINAKDNDQDTPLHIATSQYSSEIVNVLLDAKANVNVQNKVGNCPLHIAVTRVDLQKVDMLLKAGASVVTTNKEGVSFLDNTNTGIQEVYKKFQKETPKEIIRQGSEAVALYHKALRRGKLSSNIIRCMFVGHYGVGKTTLVKALLGKDRRNTQSTDGIDISIGNCQYNQDTKEWHIQDEHTEIILGIDNIIQIHLWDFAGQRIYYTTHQAHLSSRSLYFLVFNMAIGLNGEVGGDNIDSSCRLVIDFMEFWVGSIRTYVPSVEPGFPKILLIGTHCDEVQNLTKMKEEICSHFRPLIQSGMMIVRDEFFVNALEMNDDTTNGIRNAIVEFGMQYPDFGEKIPLSWASLQKQFVERKIAGNLVISLDEIKRFPECKEVTPEELALFLTFLHDLGYILYYKDARLNENVILDPQCVVDAIKCIITCKPFGFQVRRNWSWDKMRKSGKLKISKIIQIWKKTNKSQFFNHKEHLLAVMEKLDLICLPQEYDSKGHDIRSDYYYIPCMVAANPPEVLSEIPSQVRNALSTGNLITMSYHFKDVLPPAIFHRLICCALSLWPVAKPHLYHDFVILVSGRTHFIVFRKTRNRIEISIVHRFSATNVDIDLCRVIRQFVTQYLNRIIAIYNQTSEKKHSDFYEIEYNTYSLTHGFGTRENEVRGKQCQPNCQGLTEHEKRQPLDDVTVMCIAKVMNPELLTLLTAHLDLRDTDLKRIEYDFKELGCTVHCIMLLDTWKKQQDTPSVIGQLQTVLVDSPLDSHLLCQALRDKRDPQIPNQLDPKFQILQTNEEIIDAISDHVSLTYIELGLELGLHLDEILRLRLENKSNIIQVVRQMLRRWLERNKPKSRATVACLGRALLNSGCGIGSLKSFEGILQEEISRCTIM